MMDAMATAPSDDTALIAERLRFAVTRLARRMRQHTGTGLSPTQAAALATVERKLFEAALRYTRGNVSETARLLGLTRGGLRHKMDKLNL